METLSQPGGPRVSARRLKTISSSALWLCVESREKAAQTLCSCTCISLNRGVFSNNSQQSLTSPNWDIAQIRNQPTNNYCGHEAYNTVVERDKDSIQISRVRCGNAWKCIFRSRTVSKSGLVLPGYSALESIEKPTFSRGIIVRINRTGCVRTYACWFHINAVVFRGNGGSSTMQGQHFHLVRFRNIERFVPRQHLTSRICFQLYIGCRSGPCYVNWPMVTRDTVFLALFLDFSAHVPAWAVSFQSCLWGNISSRFPLFSPQKLSKLSSALGLWTMWPGRSVVGLTSSSCSRRDKCPAISCGAYLLTLSSFK